LLRCRRETSTDDSATLKNCSSDSTLNGDVIRAPAGRRSDVTDTAHRVRCLGLSTFKPFGCRQYSTAAELQHAVPLTSLATAADNTTASSTRNFRPPNPPRRTTSLSTAVPPLKEPSPPPPPTVVEKLSEIQKLASLAEKLAASRRICALSSRTLSPPLSMAASLATDPMNPLFPVRDKFRTFSAVTSSPSELNSSHRRDVTANFKSRGLVAEREEDESSVITTDIAGDLPQLSPRASTVGVDFESASTPTSDRKRPVSLQWRNSVSNSVPFQNCSREDVATAENSTASSARPGKESHLRDIEEEDCSTQNDDNITIDNRDPAVCSRPALIVSHDCSDLGINQSSMLVSSSVKDSLMMTADDGPLPVAARLIITSPVASRASFVENPHRRSMCKPLTLPLPRIDDVDAAGGTLLRRHREAELPTDTESYSNNVDPTNYGRSWYDVVHSDNGRCNQGIVATEPLCDMPLQTVVGAGYSAGGDCTSCDTQSISSQSSIVSDQSSGTLRRPISRRTSEISALNGGRDQRVEVRINVPSPVLTSRLRTLSSKGHHTTRSFSAASADHVVSKSVTGENVDRAVAKGTNLKRLKKSKHWMMGQLKTDADVDLNADIQRLSRRGADRTVTKTTFAEFAANDRRWNTENETESRPVFMSFMSNSLGRHKSLRTCSKFADHCSTAGNIIVSPQLRTAATLQH